MDDITKGILGIFTALVGVAILGVILSKNSNTTGVIQAITQGFGQDLSVATGSSNSSNLFGSGGSNFGGFTSLLGGGSSGGGSSGGFDPTSLFSGLGGIL